MNTINEIKRQYMFAIQPVKLFENQSRKSDKMFEFINAINAKESKFNPFHPNVLSEKIAKHLDIIS